MNQTDPGPLTSGDAERFRGDALVALTAFTSVTLLALLAFLIA
ncbi:hypothetical protein [Nocardiopsis sp. L17-MgMaSL7]|nr:hypothetical protein [Nocardiopsis sp. L17-MgMaSL7]PWV54947.1 hypothetical protein BDW27_104411 [Nocardiopsis sp. L17-MgMaSL7]